jgi:hypothetical protein
MVDFKDVEFKAKKRRELLIQKETVCVSCIIQTA